jgi:metal-responsive CopG/Arc/MetJ family transcriptional regulator
MLPGMTRKVAISVTDDLLAAVDSESRTERLSRSGFFAAAAREYLEKVRRQREIDTYVTSYRDVPETDEEIAVTDAFLSRSFSGD